MSADAITDPRSLDQIGSAFVAEVIAQNIANPVATLDALAGIYKAGVSISDLVTLDAWLSTSTVPGSNPPVLLDAADKPKAVELAADLFGIQS